MGRLGSPLLINSAAGIKDLGVGGCRLGTGHWGAPWGPVDAVALDQVFLLPGYALVTQSPPT